MKLLAYFLAHKKILRATVAVTAFTLLPVLLTAPACAIDPNVRIAVAYDLGGLGDGGVNDATAIGINSVRKKFGLSNLSLREVVTVGSESDRRDRLNFLAKAGYDLIVVAGSAWTTSLAAVAPNFPDIQFAIIGGIVTGNVNVSVMTFDHKEESYLAGVLAAASTTSKKIGFISSARDNSSPISLSAFTAGAQRTNSSVKVVSALVESGAYSQATQMAKSGVDIIYSRWSESADVYSAVLKQNSASKRAIKMIGIVPDQYFLNFAAAKKILLGTITENYGSAITQLVTAALNNQTVTNVIDEENGIFGQLFTLKSGAITLKNFSASSQALNQWNKTRSALVSGSLKL